jgi:hypothetical protein
MNDSIKSKIERSSLGTSSAKAARKTVSIQKASSLVQRSRTVNLASAKKAVGSKRGFGRTHT